MKGQVLGYSIMIAASIALVQLGCGTSKTGGAVASQSDLMGDQTRGADAVEKRACASCHKGKDGSLSGSATPYSGTMAYPANLTPDSETGIGDWDEATIAKAILNGIDDEDAQLCPTMPKFAQTGMGEPEARDIAAYLKSLKPVRNMVHESSCPPVKGDAASSEAGSGSGKR